MLSGNRYRAIRVMFQKSNPKREGSVHSPTLDEIRPYDVLISGGSPHFTSRFCKVE